MKELIKELEVEQKQLKRKRKTGTLPKECDLFAIIGAKRYDILEAWEAASKAQENRLFITAAINLYHELRGSNYRHGLGEDTPHTQARYADYQNKLRNLVDLEGWL